jgi:hypothetical protein
MPPSLSRDPKRVRAILKPVDHLGLLRTLSYAFGRFEFESERLSLQFLDILLKAPRATTIL